MSKKEPIFCKVWRGTQAKNGLKALRYCIENKKDVDNAFIVKNLGFVSFKYGKEGNSEKDFKGGYGISHIIAKRDYEKKGTGLKTAEKIIDVLVFGKITKTTAEKGTIQIEKDGYRAILSLNWHNDKVIWLLTGFKLRL